MGKTLAQKILQAHTEEEIKSFGQIVQVQVDKVLANDITAPLAIESFNKMGAKEVFDTEKIILVCDHFTPNKDIKSAEQVKKVREFAKRQGIVHYYEGGNVGVEHALLPELGLVGPWEIIVGADSHTCTYGALGAFATGLGSTDIAYAMAFGETWFKVPESILVKVEGKLPLFVTGKDIVLFLIGKIGVDGALYKALEFTGNAIANLDIEQRMTIANMAIEAGGKAGIFAADDKTLAYTQKAGRKDRVLSLDEDAEYVQRIEFRAEDLQPVVACPHLPENVRNVDELKNVKIDQVVLGSCTNGRITDLRQAAEIIKGHKVAKGVRFIVLPATPLIYKQALKEGLLEIFLEAGAVIGPPTCGPCLGGHMGILAGGERCLATTNRNFKGRMGSLESEVYLASPYVAAASAVTGCITNPQEIKGETDAI
ncbi:3-isopropylmalate/(R)-2-methylmalate dehydratase large subunit [Desulfonauticus submarinus]|uniref:3-isopropylmalate dehydratase large subunit n=1 Tax=Desulfonauticus submarinus TaxID=206665 RepID=A0A1H0B3L7_9BACT|nr:3-isopropylmalate dehydratase large subunit [Desulfonauticus submarinus]SDN40246.1 3-isopropylmalate/(R)-2-methylmalate dehydratase large subunit [Desulfonauticus submarinus]